MAVHIGEVIHDLIKERGLKAKVVADFVNVSESTLFDIYKRSSIDVYKLVKFSQLLNQNLFLYYLDEEPIKSMFGKQVHELQNRIMELEAEIKAKDQNIDYLSDLVATQKKVIALHESSKGEHGKSTKRK